MFGVFFIAAIALIALAAVSAAVVQFARDGYRRTPTLGR